jgi:hypothetical protein
MLGTTKYHHPLKDATLDLISGLTEKNPCIMDHAGTADPEMQMYRNGSGIF